MGFEDLVWAGEMKAGRYQWNRMVCKSLYPNESMNTSAPVRKPNLNVYLGITPSVLP